MIARLVGGPCDGWRRDVPDDSTECHAVRQGDAPPGECEVGTYQRIEWCGAPHDLSVPFIWLGWSIENPEGYE